MVSNYYELLLIKNFVIAIHMLSDCKCMMVSDCKCMMSIWFMIVIAMNDYLLFDAYMVKSILLNHLNLGPNEGAALSVIAYYCM